MTEEERPPEHEHPRPLQFRLRGLLTLFAGCALYFGQLTCAPWARGPQSDKPLPWQTTATIIVAWLIFFVYYARARLWGAGLAHCVGPILSTCLFVVLDGWGVPLSISARTALVGCYISTLFSFPVALLTLLAVAVDRRFSRGEPP